MKSHHLVLFLGLIAILAFATACSQFFPAPLAPTLQPVPVSLPTITPILIIMPSPTSAQIPTVTRAATASSVSSVASSGSASSKASSVSSTLASTASSTSSLNRISFPAGGTTASLAGTVAANGTDRYILRVLAGQSMTVNFAPVAENVTIQISGADGNVLVSGGAKFTTGTFPLTVTQDYFITVISSRNTPTNYALQVTIPPLGQEPTPTPKRISFAVGGTSATMQGALPKNGMDRWVIRVQAGQTMTAKAIAQNGNVMLIVFGVDGDVYQTDHVGSPDFSAQMRTTQDYYIDVRAWGDTAPSYTLQITIPPK